MISLPSITMSPGSTVIEPPGLMYLTTRIPTLVRVSRTVITPFSTLTSTGVEETPSELMARSGVHLSVPSRAMITLLPSRSGMLVAPYVSVASAGWELALASVVGVGVLVGSALVSSVPHPGQNCSPVGTGVEQFVQTMMNLLERG